MNARRFALHAFVGSVAASDLSPAALRVALALAKRANSDGLAWPHLETIIAETRRSRASVLAALPELEAAGFVTVEKAAAGDKARGKGNRYYVHVPGEQVQDLGPVQVQEVGPSRSRISDPTGPGSRTPEPRTPLSVKDPIEPTNEPPTAGPVTEPDDHDPDRGVSLELAERILRESAKAHGRTLGTGKAVRDAVAALHEHVNTTCAGHAAVAVWALVAMWAHARPIKGEAPGLALLSSDPGRWERSPLRDGAETIPPPDWVHEINDPGWTERKRQGEEERAQRAAEERERRILEASERWRPQTREEAEASRAVEERWAQIKAMTAAPRKVAPARWVVERDTSTKILSAWREAYRAHVGSECVLSDHDRETAGDVARVLLHDHGDEGALAAAHPMIADVLATSDPPTIGALHRAAVAARQARLREQIKPLGDVA